MMLTVYSSLEPEYKQINLKMHMHMCMWTARQTNDI